MMRLCQRATVIIGSVMLWVALPARAQLQVGDNTSLNLSGNLAFGYNADFSNHSPSDHGMNPGGNADLSGFYYSPGFVSFDVQPFYDQSRTNSTYQSVFQSSGVTGSASIFSGSNFPGSINYSKIYNSQGGYNVPGVGNLTTRGNSDNLGINWGIRIPDYPKVSLQFADGNNESSIFGTDANSQFHTKSFGVGASHMLAGFSLNGGYHYTNTSGLTPSILVDEPSETTHTSSNSVNFGVGRALPLHGTFMATAEHSDITSDAMGERFSGTVDSVGGGVGFEPVHNLNVGAGANYSNNLEGNLYQAVIASGTAIPASLLSSSTHSLDISTHANYLIPPLHLTLVADADRRQQTILGMSLTADTFNEMATYGHDFLGGFLNATTGVTETTENANNGEKTLGLFDNASYQRNILGFNVTGSVNYMRNTQTILIGYTSSGYGYSGGIGRKLSPYTYVGFNAVGSKTVFSNQPGAGNFNQSYQGSLTLKRFSASGSYGKANGLSFLTPSGLTIVTTPVVTPLQTITFGGTSYSFGASTNPMRGLVLSGTYSSSRNNTIATSATSNNSTRLLNGFLQYKVRQLWVTGGYMRIQQEISITGQPAASDSSFYVGITRWFKFF